MAKQAGDIFIVGTLDDLTFYKMEGHYFVRMKSSLTGKRFWKDKAFERSRQSCKRFSKGNTLASRLYRSIEKEKRQRKLFCFLKGRAILLLKEGKSLLQAEKVLMGYLIEFGFIEKLISEPKQGMNKEDLSHYTLYPKTFQKSNPTAIKINFLKGKARLTPVLPDHRKSLEFEFLPDP